MGTDRAAAVDVPALGVAAKGATGRTGRADPVTRLTGSLGTATYDGTGAIAHIDGHGNAQRWVWLHAALGNGDILELVSATARRPGLRALPALALLQLRLDGKDWPRDSVAAAPLFTTRIDDQAFRIRGVVGGRRLTAEVTLPAERCVSWRLCGTAHAEIGTRP